VRLTFDAFERRDLELAFVTPSNDNGMSHPTIAQPMHQESYQLNKLEHYCAQPGDFECLTQVLANLDATKCRLSVDLNMKCVFVNQNDNAQTLARTIPTTIAKAGFQYSLCPFGPWRFKTQNLVREFSLQR
jgi:hypothetical protein